MPAHRNATKPAELNFTKILSSAFNKLLKLIWYIRVQPVRIYAWIGFPLGTFGPSLWTEVRPEDLFPEKT